MKYLSIINLCLVLSFSLIFAQNQDSTAGKKQEEKKQVSEQQQEKSQAQDKLGTEKNAGKKSVTPKMSKKKLEGFVDLNANGIDDRLEASGKGKGKGQPRDRFVDNDGDGICDGKESAIGLRKLFKRRKGKSNR